MKWKLFKLRVDSQLMSWVVLTLNIHWFSKTICDSPLTDDVLFLGSFPSTLQWRMMHNAPPSWFPKNLRARPWNFPAYSLPHTLWLIPPSEKFPFYISWSFRDVNQQKSISSFHWHLTSLTPKRPSSKEKYCQRLFRYSYWKTNVPWNLKAPDLVVTGWNDPRGVDQERRRWHRVTESPGRD